MNMKTLLLLVPMAIVLEGFTFSIANPVNAVPTFSSGPYGYGPYGAIGFYPDVFGQSDFGYFSTMKKRTKGLPASGFDIPMQTIPTETYVKKWSHHPIVWDPYSRYIWLPSR